ncbi:acyltransferase family protein [Sporichthya polymorpha]|uniref:acyltransferase family protein n=1 Tax=Sporichthya polymorpha TaxID=35751 RepID=UPI0012ECB306|nr:acyltransferase family protein [Sporichthya polymorpha]
MSRERAKRTDIQALRALAVGLVLAFHLQPKTLTGGYVGVDVFFVISGFLITSHLLASPPRGLGDLLTFWSRRIARLLPAALLVLAATLAGSRLVAPETQWRETADDVFAAGFYVVNWRFAEQAVDYLAADDLPSPVQHYWSLSVEEQFYAGWPVLILVLFALGGRVGRGGPGGVVVLGGLVLTTLLSLAWSVHFTGEDPARGYFVTPTRIWELGVGGILAAVLLVRGSSEPSGSPGPVAVRRDVIAAVGLAAIAWSAWSYSAQTPFPGHHALVPVLGTAAVIAAAPRAGLGRVLAVRPVQYIGDISYSIYLWHWPLIVLVPAATGHDLNAGEKLGVLVATLVLAAVTKHWVEDPFMRPRTRRPVALRFGAAATGMAVLAGLTVLQNVEVRDREADARRQLVAAASNRCFGAAALAKPSCAKGMGEVTPEASAFAATDKSQAYPDVPDGQDCFSYLPDYPSVRCEFGPAEAKTRIALVGNSHAGHWLPALQELADRRRWKITTFLSSQCALSPVNQEFATPEQSDACVEWVRRTTAEVAAGRFATVVLSNRLSVPVAGMALPDSLPLYERGYRTVLETWKRARVRVLVIRDTPTPGIADLNSVPDCLAGKAPEECSGPRQSWLPQDPAVTAVRAVKDRRIRTVDLTDRICGPRVCNPVVGGVVVYFDGSHLSATYARTLAPYLEPALRALLRL